MSVAASSNEDLGGENVRRAQRAHEPSMEEILASIRAIIADDREPSPAPPPPAPIKLGPQIVYSNDAPQAQAEVAELAAAPSEPESQTAPSEAPALGPTVVWSRSESALPPPPPLPPIMEEEPLLSDEAGEAVAASFQALSETMTARGMEVAEGLARELLKPMIKDWLDQNLPAIVERLVRAEIARVARGGR